MGSEMCIRDSKERVDMELAKRAGKEKAKLARKAAKAAAEG